MPLSSRDAFKFGFLSRCVEDRLSAEQIESSVKRACDLLEKSAIIDTLINKGGDLLGGAAKYGIPAAIAAPFVLGAGGGYGLSKLTDIDDRDVADIKDREVISEYGRQTEKLKRQKAVRDYLKARQKTGRIFM